MIIANADRGATLGDYGDSSDKKYQKRRGNWVQCLSPLIDKGLFFFLVYRACYTNIDSVDLDPAGRI